MMALLACNLEPPLPLRDSYLAWATKQIHLLLGDAGRSYVVGFGRNFPKQPHHRARYDFLNQSCKLGRAFRVGLGLKIAKCLA